MTIQYSDNYFKILAHWRGSAWKAVWKELLAWLILFYVIKVALEFGIPESMEADAHKFIHVFRAYTEKVPLQFLLGFYVGQVISRWWTQIQQLPWPDDVMAWVCACVPGDDHDSRLRRHLVARYLVLSETLVFRSISTRIRKRFPTLELLVSAGLMTEEELKLYRACPCPNTRWQLPIQWAINGVLIPLNSREKNPVSLGSMGHMINTFNAFRDGLRQLFIYDWISIPLVYTQTVSVVVYGYFALCLVGYQAFGKEADIYVPVLAILQFIFYVGWFKVAQDLMLPFGEDDDDIELNYILDRHLTVALTMANHVATSNPPLVEDRYFKAIQKDGDKSETFNLAYTHLALSQSRDRPPKLLASVKITDPNVQLAMSFEPPPYFNYEKMKEKTSPKPADPAAESSIPGVASVVKRALKRFKGHIPREPVFF